MNIRRIGAALVAAATARELEGCQAGPSVITNGRAQYNEAIARTTDQQTLGAIVRMRYDESIGMLAVTSVTANMSIKTNAQVQVGIGPESTYAGNLVPLSGGVVYEENPTITYAPVEGPQYLREYLSPNPLEVVVLAARSARRPAFVLSLLLERINGLRNSGSAGERDSGFSRAIGLMELLRSRGELDWGETDKPGAFAVILMVQGGGTAEMKELVELLRVDATPTASGRVVLPLRLSSLEVSPNTIDVSTRSVFDLLQLAAGGVEVPSEDLNAGVASRAWAHAEAEPRMRVRWDTSRPKNAAVEVRHGNGWYYIDATDHESKIVFNIIQTLLTARARGSLSEGRSAPVLTIPVSK